MNRISRFQDFKISRFQDFKISRFVAVACLVRPRRSGFFGVSFLNKRAGEVLFEHVLSFETVLLVG